MNLLRRAALLIGALAALGPAASRLQACTCIDIPSLEENLASAAVVFAGRVTAIQPAGDGLNVIVTLAPLMRWKGGVSATVTVVTGENGGLCGVAFETGREYLVFATPYTPGPPALVTHLCTRTAPVENNPDVQKLGAPLSPTPVRAVSWGGVKRVWR